MKASCSKIILLLYFGFLSAGTAIAQSTNSPQPSISASSSSSQQDSLKVIVRDEVDRLKKDNKEQVEHQVKDEINTRFNEASNNFLGRTALLTAVFGGMAGLALAGRWKQQFDSAYEEVIRKEIAKQLEVGVQQRLDEYLADAKQKTEDITLLRKATDDYRENLYGLEGDFDSQIRKYEIIQELSQVLPPEDRFFQDQSTDEIRNRLQELTFKLLTLKLKSKELFLTFDDHTKWGDALYYSKDYRGAETQYKKAISLYQGAYKAWFGRGNALRKQAAFEDDMVRRQRKNQRAIEIFREGAQT
jgi:tetratricopeptide (TPR) repeat protein